MPVHGPLHFVQGDKGRRSAPFTTEARRSQRGTEPFRSTPKKNKKLFVDSDACEASESFVPFVPSW